MHAGDITCHSNRQCQLRKPLCPSSLFDGKSSLWRIQLSSRGGPDLFFRDSCAFWHLFIGTIFNFLGFIVVRCYLQQPLVLDLNNLKTQKRKHDKSGTLILTSKSRPPFTFQLEFPGNETGTNIVQSVRNYALRSQNHETIDLTHTTLPVS